MNSASLEAAAAAALAGSRPDVEAASSEIVMTGIHSDLGCLAGVEVVVTSSLLSALLPDFESHIFGKKLRRAGFASAKFRLNVFFHESVGEKKEASVASTGSLRKKKRTHSSCGARSSHSEIKRVKFLPPLHNKSVARGSSA